MEKGFRRKGKLRENLYGRGPWGRNCERGCGNEETGGRLGEEVGSKASMLPWLQKEASMLLSNKLDFVHENVWLWVIVVWAMPWQVFEVCVKVLFRCCGQKKNRRGARMKQMSSEWRKHGGHWTALRKSLLVARTLGYALLLCCGVAWGIVVWDLCCCGHVEVREVLFVWVIKLGVFFVLVAGHWPVDPWFVRRVGAVGGPGEGEGGQVGMAEVGVLTVMAWNVGKRMYLNTADIIEHVCREHRVDVVGFIDPGAAAGWPSTKSAWQENGYVWILPDDWEKSRDKDARGQENWIMISLAVRDDVAKVCRWKVNSVERWAWVQIMGVGTVVFVYSPTNATTSQAVWADRMGSLAGELREEGHGPIIFAGDWNGACSGERSVTSRRGDACIQALVSQLGGEIPVKNEEGFTWKGAAGVSRIDMVVGDDDAKMRVMKAEALKMWDGFDHKAIKMWLWKEDQEDVGGERVRWETPRGKQ